jgi:hypothetical protein
MFMGDVCGGNILNPGCLHVAACHWGHANGQLITAR